MKHNYLLSIFATLFLAFLTVLSSNAQNRWNIHAGGSISHLCESPLMSSDKTYGWGGGAFVGGGYEVNFNPHWSLTPQVDIAFNNNGATLSSPEQNFYFNHDQWLSTWNINIPIIASYRFAIADDTKLRFGAGPYLQYGFAGRHYKYDSDEKERLCGIFSKRINVGVTAEAAIETGSHLSYFLRVQYPFLKKGWVRNTIVISAGIGYSF